MAESICDTIAVMHDGKIIEQGETLHIFAFAAKCLHEAPQLQPVPTLNPIGRCKTKFLKYKQPVESWTGCFLLIARLHLCFNLPIILFKKIVFL